MCKGDCGECICGALPTVEDETVDRFAEAVKFNIKHVAEDKRTPAITHAINAVHVWAEGTYDDSSTE